MPTADHVGVPSCAVALWWVRPFIGLTFGIYQATFPFAQWFFYQMAIAPQSKAEMEALATLSNIESVQLMGTLGLHEEYASDAAAIVLFLRA